MTLDFAPSPKRFGVHVDAGWCSEWRVEDGRSGTETRTCKRCQRTDIRKLRIIAEEDPLREEHSSGVLDELRPAPCDLPMHFPVRFCNFQCERSNTPQDQLVPTLNTFPVLGHPSDLAFLFWSHHKVHRASSVPMSGSESILLKGFEWCLGTLLPF